VLTIYLVNAGFNHLRTIALNTLAYDTVQSLAQVQKHGAYSNGQAHAATSIAAGLRSVKAAMLPLHFVFCGFILPQYKTFCVR
jgi:hypothetical protein